MPDGDFVWGGWRKPYQYILGEAEDKYATFFKGTVAPMKLNKGKKYKLGDILVTIKSSGELFRSGDYSHYGVSYQVEFPHPRNARNTIQGYLSMLPNGGFRLNVGGVVIIRAESGGFGMAQKTSEYDWFLNHYRGGMGESVEVTEAKRQPEATYFPSYTAALNAARAKAEREGYKIDENDWDTRVTHGYPGRPAEGETTNVKIGLSRVGKGGKPEAAVLVIAVYGMKQSFELTSYISKVPMLSARLRWDKTKRVGESVEVGIEEAKLPLTPKEKEVFDTLRATVAKWDREGKRFDPQSPAMKALLDYLDAAPKDLLQKLADANIGLYSDLAKNRLRQTG